MARCVPLSRIANINRPSAPDIDFYTIANVLVTIESKNTSFDKYARCQTRNVFRMNNLARSVSPLSFICYFSGFIPMSKYKTLCSAPEIDFSFHDVMKIARVLIFEPPHGKTNNLHR